MCGNNFGGCYWIIILLLIFFCCGNGNNGCGASNNGCGCNNDCGCGGCCERKEPVTNVAGLLFVKLT